MDIGSRSQHGAELEGLYTVPDERRKGHATLCLGQICRHLLSSLPRLTLRVDEKDESTGRGSRARWASWPGRVQRLVCWTRRSHVPPDSQPPSPLRRGPRHPPRAPRIPRWLPLALERFDEVLVDHAHCEKKAAANALSLLQAYPDLPGLPAQMARLAREESAHLARVLDLMAARGLTLTKDAGDPYAQGLQKLIRTPARGAQAGPAAGGGGHRGALLRAALAARRGLEDPALRASTGSWRSPRTGTSRSSSGWR